jgi:hypothetical protein
MIKLYKVIVTQIERGYVVTSKNGWLWVAMGGLCGGYVFVGICGASFGPQLISNA